MNWGRTWAIALKVFRTLRRDKRGLVLMLAGPILQMMVIGFVFAAELSSVTTVVVDQDQGPLGGLVAENLNGTVLDLRTSHSPKAARDDVKNGQAWAAILIPPGFSDTVLGNATEPITLVIDGSNQQVTAAVTGQVQAALQAALAKLRGANATAGPDLRGLVASDLVYGAHAEYIDFFVAALMGLTVFNFTAITTVTSFVTERSSGMLARLQTGPVRPSEIVLGHAIGYGTVAALQASILLTTAVLLYGINVEGPPWLAFLVVILLGVASQALGTLLSATARRESQAIQSFPIILIPAFVVSGTFVPVFSLPAFLQPLAYLVPLYWSSEALRSILIRGWDLDRVWPHVLVLAAFAAVFLLLAIWMLRRQKR